jgi:4-amino-4-deoxy-L-arabinose transferase-like glycosyltransferase
VLDSIANSLAASFITFSALLLGYRLVLLPYPKDSLTARAEFWLLCGGLGLGALSITIVIISLLNTQLLFFLLVGGAALLFNQTALMRLFNDGKNFLTVRLPRLLWLCIVISLALTLLTALTPPTAWDALVYHLTIPYLAFTTNRLTPNFDIIPHAHFPQLMSSLYLFGMFLHGDIAAQLLHFVYGLLTLGLITLSARQFYSRAAVPLALAVTLSMPMLLLLSTWAYNDVALAFYTLASVYAYRRWHTERDARYLAVSALLAGFALGLKYTSFVLPACIVLLFVLHGDSTHWRGTLRLVIIYSAITLVVASPWYIKNFFFTGNPTYPFVFGGAQWDTLRSAWYSRAGTGIGLDLWALITLPIVSMQGYRDANFVDGRMGPLVLILMPLLFMANKIAHPAHGKKTVALLRMLRGLDMFVLVFWLHYLVWVIGIIGSSSLWQTRLLLPALVLMTAPLGQAVVNLAQFDHPQFSLKRIVTMIIVLVLALTLFRQTIEFAIINPIAYLSGTESREHFVARQTGAYADAMNAVAQLPANARVQFMWEPRSYLAYRAQHSVRADPLIDALPHLVATQGSVESAVRQLKAEGFTHILVFEAGASFAFQNLTDQFTPAHTAQLAQLERDYLRVVFDNQAYRLFEIR